MVGAQRHALVALLPGKTRYPLYRRVGEPQGLSGRVQKFSPPIGIRSPDHPLHLSICRKYVEKIQVPLKPDKNNCYCTRKRECIYDRLSLNSSSNEKCFRQKLRRKSKHAIYVLWFFSYKSCRLWDNVENYDKAREATDNNKIQCRALRDGHLRLQTHTQNT